MPAAYMQPQGQVVPPTAERASLAGQTRDWVVIAEAHTRLYTPAGQPTGESLPAYSAHLVVAETDSALQLCPADLAQRLPNGLLRMPNKEYPWAKKRDLILWRTALRPAGAHGWQRVIPVIGLERLAPTFKAALPRLKASLDSSQWAGTVPGGGTMHTDVNPSIYFVIKEKPDSLLLCAEPILTEATAARRLLGWQPAAAFTPFHGQALRLKLRHADSLRTQANSRRERLAERDFYRLDTLWLDSAGSFKAYQYSFRYPPASLAKLSAKRRKALPPLMPAKIFYAPVLDGFKGWFSTVLPLAAQKPFPDSLTRILRLAGRRPELRLANGMVAHPGLPIYMRARPMRRLYTIDTGRILSGEELTQLLAPLAGLNYASAQLDRAELSRALFRFYLDGFAQNGPQPRPDSIPMGLLFARIGEPRLPTARRVALSMLSFADLADTMAVPTAECKVLMRQLSGLQQAVEQHNQPVPIPYPGKQGKFVFVPNTALRLAD